MRVTDLTGIQKHRTEEEMRKALSDLIHRKHTLHIPPEMDDADIVMGDVILELLEARRNSAQGLAASIMQVSQKCAAEIEQIEARSPDGPTLEEARLLLHNMLIWFGNVTSICRHIVNKTEEIKPRPGKTDTAP